MKRCVWAVLLFSLLTVSSTQAATLGAGDVPAANNDTGDNFLAISRVGVLLTAGTYTATSFNYQFTEAQTTIGGRVIPLVLVSPSTDVYTVVALGDLLTFAGVTSFASTPFGGSDTFTLASDTTVYGGFFWEHDTGITQRVPIAFAGAGSPGTFLRYGGGVATPVLNANVSGGLGFGNFSTRRYDFSVTVPTTDPVPEPGSLALVGLGCVCLGALRRRRTHERTGSPRSR